MSAISLSYDRVLSIIGDVMRIAMPPQTRDDPEGPRYGDLAMVQEGQEPARLAQVVKLDEGEASLQIFPKTRGLSTRARARFLGHPPRVPFSPNILGRVFAGDGQAVDNGPSLEQDPQVEIAGPSANPARRALASKLIRTNVPMIDVFNCLVESQKIPIFSMSGEPYDALLARIGVQAEADVVVFGGLGLTFDEYWRFRKSFEDAGAFGRTVMFVNQASDPPLERLLVPDMALAVAEKFAVDEKKRVLVLLTDMTAYADALKEVGIALDRVPSNRGYLGDLYSQLARRYEKAAVFPGAGSVTILTVTTMPGGDVTHPVPDNTGYITEGQFYLRDSMIDPFGSLSRLKRQQLMGERIRARVAVAASLGKVDAAASEAGAAIPMLADKRIDVDGLVTLGKVTLGTQNIAGVRLPVVENIEIIRKPYGRMVRPHWVDTFVERLAAALRLKIEVGVAKKRLELIEAAVIKVTQRVNLFDKVLIPQAETNIRRILVYLGDAERAAVVSAKIAKGKREAWAAS